MAEILVGTAGWSYDDWANVVYPPGAGGRFDRLLYLANLCDSLEINSSFYRIPNRRTIDSWIDRVSDLPRFKFSAKLYRGLTHERDEQEADHLLSEYVDAVTPIYAADRLGAILLQFPWSFKFGRENLQWLTMLIKRLSPMPLAVEVRHKGWLNDEYLGFLREHRVGFCNLDQPPIRGNIEPTAIVTADFSYVRFHGRNSAKWFAENENSAERYNYHYSLRELEDWAARIRKMAQETQRVYAYMNNHVGGQGLANALELKSMLAGKAVPAPRQLVLAFPELQRFSVGLTEPAAKPKKSSRPDDTGLLFE